MRSHLGNVTLAGLHDAEASVEPAEDGGWWSGVQNTLKEMSEPVMALIPGMTSPQITEQPSINIPVSIPTTIPTPKPTTMPAVDPNDVRAPTIEEPDTGPSKALIYGGIAVAALVGGVLLVRRRKKGRRS